MLEFLISLASYILLLGAWLIIFGWVVDRLAPKILPDWLSYRKFMLRRAAKNSMKSNEVLWGEERHEWRDVLDPAREFPDLDHVWISATTGHFEKLGCQYIRDIENTTLTGQLPKMRTFIRTLLSPDGRTTIGIYHFKNRGLLGWWVGVLGGKIDARIIDIESEFHDGTYLCITTASRQSTLHEPPHTTRCFGPEDATPEQLYQWHQAWLDYLHQTRGVVPTIMKDHHDMMEMEHRRQAKDGAYRRSKNYFTEEDANRIALNDRFARDGEELARIMEKLRVDNQDK
ncbi:MAG: hypothetical protein JJU11_04220 [Candidatus Sumerlaeia bacterium]|nr:hypothetical protein [Candidatus Sumerlaeia bacterium]